ncbi:MAG: helix-turn-helix domain-containing protein [Actinomycetes bacterium]
MSDGIEKPFLGVSETARLLGVHENTVRNWMTAGTLVSARLPGSRQHRFAREGGAAPGWDGSATSAGSVFLPAGEPRFEFGTGKNIKGKAQSDYDKRVLALPADRDAIFVFATPRNWAGGRGWAAERAMDKKFKGVKTIDVHVLKGWLRATPSMHSWISERLGFHPRDAQSMSKWWEAFQGRVQHRIPASFFVAGRAREVDELLTLLEAGSPGDPVAPSDATGEVGLRLADFLPSLAEAAPDAFQDAVVAAPVSALGARDALLVSRPLRPRSRAADPGGRDRPGWSFERSTAREPAEPHDRVDRAKRRHRRRKDRRDRARAAGRARRGVVAARESLAQRTHDGVGSSQADLPWPGAEEAVGDLHRLGPLRPRAPPARAPPCRCSPAGCGGAARPRTGCPRGTRGGRRCSSPPTAARGCRRSTCATAPWSGARGSTASPAATSAP